MIKIGQLSKTVSQGGQDTAILHKIDFTADSGDFISIMGPSGSGKSTLLNIIGLLDMPTVGEYMLEGQNVNKISNRKLASIRSRNIGFVFQAYMLIPRLTVIENVEIPLLYTSLSRKERRKRVENALSQVGMLEKAKEPIVKLSGGQKQKTAIARAIVHDPALILADEPTGNLDQKSKEDVLQIFTQLNQQKKTLIIVTHDPEVSNVAEQHYVMKNGVWVSTPAPAKERGV